MGSGKTTWAIDYMNNANQLETRFIYITPFLDEVQRIIENTQNRNFIEPNTKNDAGSKLESLKKLLVDGVDIVSTHSLFQLADDEVIELLTDGGYTLILDEVMDCVETADVKPSDIKRLLDNKDITIKNNRVKWVGDPEDDSRYKDIRLLAQAGNLFCYRGKFLVWTFPPKVFKTFDNVFVLTYLFHAQIQRYYFDLHGFKYKYQAVKELPSGKYTLTEYSTRKENRKDLYSLIDIYQGKMNDIGNRKNALSATWIRNADIDKLKELHKNLYNFFHNIAKAKKDEVYFSTLKEYQYMIAPRGFKPSRKPNRVKSDVAIPLNERATNRHAHKRAIAYIYNRYQKPNIMAFFIDNGVVVNEDLAAVSDLLQWIWRSRIRNGEPVQLYLPSRRMRELLKAWAGYEL